MGSSYVGIMLTIMCVMPNLLQVSLMDDYPLFCWLDGLFRLCSDLSVCVTTVLCVTRCVVFTKPFILIKNWIVYTVCSLFVSKPKCYPLK